MKVAKPKFRFGHLQEFYDNFTSCFTLKFKYDQPIEAMETAVNYSATNHCTDKRDVFLICLVMSVFISMTLDSITSFSRIKNLRTTCKCLCYCQIFGGISFHVMVEIW